MRHCRNTVECQWPKCDCVEDLSGQPALPDEAGAFAAEHLLNASQEAALYDLIERLSPKAPVAWRREWEGEMIYIEDATERDEPIERWEALYTLPPQKGSA